MEKIGTVISQELSKDNARLTTISDNQLPASSSSTNAFFSTPMAQKLAKIAPKPSDFMILVNPNVQQSVLGKRLGEISLDSNIPTLGVLCKFYGKETATEWTYLQIMDFIYGCEQQKGEQDTDVYKFSETFVLMYPYINIYEFCYFLGSCRVGRWGQMYGVSGTNQLGGMFQKFLAYRKDCIFVCESEREQLRREQELASIPPNSYQLYLGELRKQAESGNEEATQILKRHLANPPP